MRILAVGANMNSRSNKVVIALLLAFFVIFGLSIAKEADVQGESYPPVITDAGGPDNFGYTWIDSDEQGGPTFEWVDISSIGVPVTLGDDASAGPFDLGFDFSYYGNDFSSLYICSNGFLSFTSNSSSLANVGIPTAAEPNNLLAVFWDDLNPSAAGQVYYYSDPGHGRFIVSYDGVPHYSNSGSLFFQVILNQDGSIVYQYLSMDDGGHGNNGATIGIENATGDDGLQVCYNADYVHAELAVFFAAIPPFDYDVAPTAIVTPTGQGQAGIPFTPSVRVENMGAMAAAFPVSFTITFNSTVVYDEQVNVPELGSGETYVAEFPEYTPDTEGMYTLAAMTELSNDENTGNDMISRSFTVQPAILPPNNLRATSDQDGVVPLHWSEPGMMPCSTIVYDDGVVANAYYFYASTNLIANSFEAVAPIQICTVFVHVLTQGDPYWPWPDPNHDPVQVKVFDDNGSGYPGDMLADETVTATLGQTIAVAFDPPLECSTDMFWVAFNNISDSGPYDGLALDAATDFPQYKWQRLDGTWSIQDTYSGDQMIRASVVSAGRNVLLTENNPAMNDDPVINDTQDLLGYNVYRDMSANVPIDEDHMIAELVSETNYDDEDVTNGNTYYYVVTAVYDDGESGPSNEDFATPHAGGQMDPNPGEMYHNGDAGNIEHADLILMNDGDMDVNFTITCATEDRLYTTRDVPYTSNSAAAKFWSNSETFDKSNTTPEEHNPPVITGSGGPDEFGYVWVDSDEDNGPTYGWIDPSGHNPLYMTDDDNQGPFGLEFPFSFYGQTFYDFRVCSNGFISFTSSATTYSNTSIPSPTAPLDLVAPFWEDLNPGGGGQIYWYADDEMAVVSWVDVPAFSSGYGPFTFQVILYPNGRILFQYENMIPQNNRATIGIQDGTGSIGLQVAFNSDYVYDGLATLIKTPWLSVDPSAGVITAGGSTTIDVIMDATDLEPNIYHGTLNIYPSDANGDMQMVSVPVTLDLLVGIDEETSLPTTYALAQNYPNPFNARTEISFALPQASDVDLSIYNMLGQKVATLVSGQLPAGNHSVNWDASDVATGVYFYKITAGDFSEIHQMTLLK